MNDTGGAKVWILAFLLASGIGFGALIGIGCAIGANACPFTDARSETATEGSTLFLRNCAVCHGIEADGTDRGGPSLVDPPADGLTFDELTAKIERGRPFKGMPRFEGTFTAGQIDAVARYLIELREETP